MYSIPRYHEQSFDFITWRNGSIYELLNINHRYEIIIANADNIRKYAIGYCESDYLPCRPKPNQIAVMFILNHENFWTHFRKEEFNAIFKII